MIYNLRKLLGLLTEAERKKEQVDQINKLQNKFGIPEKDVPWENLRDDIPVKTKEKD